MSTTTPSPTTASAQLHIDTSHPSPATARVAVVGEVDLATTRALREWLLRVLRDQRPHLLDVDLAGVTFLDCTGIGALVAAHNAAIHAGGQLRISHPQPIVRRVLEVAGLLGVVTGPRGSISAPLRTRQAHPPDQPTSWKPVLGVSRAASAAPCLAWAADTATMDL